MITQLEYDIALTDTLNSYAPRYFGDKPMTLDNVKQYIIESKVPGMRSVEFTTAEYNDYFVVAFQGTATNDDWWADFNFIQKQDKLVRGVAPDIKVHTGVENQTNLALPTVQSILNNQRGKKIIITGHSLGGGIATLTAANIKTQYPDLNILPITFASLKVGNWAFADYYNKILPNHVRVWYNNDIVERMPPTDIWYRHVGTAIHITDRNMYNPWYQIFGNANDHYPTNYLNYKV